MHVYIKGIRCLLRSRIICVTPFARLKNSIHTSPRKYSEDMNLSNVVKRLHGIASPSLAGSWDNVGLLVEPSPPHEVKTIFLTNDLTPPVLQEAISCKSDLIISYHPPIFAPLKRLTQKKWKEEIIIKCIENRIAVYSPHTSYDCVLGGVNDWLIGCFDIKEIRPVEQYEEFPSSFTHTVSISVANQDVVKVMDALSGIQEINITQLNDRSGEDVILNIQCGMSSLRAVMAVLDSCKSVTKNVEAKQLSKVPKPGYGPGRRASLQSPISVDEAVKVVKKHLGLQHVRLARGTGAGTVSSVAVCAGSGSSVLRNVRTDLYVTGEMSHHEVLDAMYNGISVILCDHSNTERGYLPVLKTELEKKMEAGVTVLVSNIDADPLSVV